MRRCVDSDVGSDEYLYLTTVLRGGMVVRGSVKGGSVIGWVVY